jgi:RND family efflux transporter MFP subunit
MKKINITKKQRRVIVGIVLLLGLMISMNSLLATKKESKTNEDNSFDLQKTSVEVALVASQDFAENINLSGTAKPMEEVLVSPKMSGKLISFLVSEGDNVNAGQVIARIEQDAVLLSSHNNAQTGLTNTIAAASQEVSNAELAVITAESNLVNIKINTEENLKSAKLSVEAAEIALAGAEKNLKNTGDNNEQSVKNAYDNMMISLQGNLLTIKTALTATGNIIGEDPGDKGSNDDYESVLGVRKTQSLSDTKGLFLQARSKYEEVYGNYQALSANSGYEEIDSAAKEINEALDLIKNLLNQAIVMLDNTITKSDFSSSDLSGLKTIVNTNLTAITTAMNTLQAGQQAIIGAGLAETNNNDAISSAFEAANKNLERAQQGLVSAEAQAISQVDIYTKQLDAAKAGLESVKRRTQLQISSARAQVDSVSAQLSNTVVTAPISGILNQRLSEVGEMALAGQPVASIINADSIKIELAVTEFDIGKISEGQEVGIFLSAYPKEKFTGTVYYTGLAADMVSKKYPVKIQIANSDKKIKAGMVAEVEISLGEQNDVLLIPRTAVFMENDVEQVFVVDQNGLIKILTISTEPAGEDTLIVREGLSVGDKVVINGNYNLSAGEEVIIE